MKKKKQKQNVNFHNSFSLYIYSLLLQLFFSLGWDLSIPKFVAQFGYETDHFFANKFD